MSELSLAALWPLCERELPWTIGRGIAVEALAAKRCRLRLPLRGTAASRHEMLSLADLAIYLALLSETGAESQLAVINLACHFLRPPAAADVLAEARVLKLGRRLAYGEATLTAAGAGSPGLLAHATASYARGTGA